MALAVVAHEQPIGFEPVIPSSSAPTSSPPPGAVALLARPFPFVALVSVSVA